MNSLQRAAVLVTLIEALRREGSWCGATHLQKACFFLQELFGVPLEFDFTLYKHGPYSFGLTDELTALRADSILGIEMPDPRYGPRYVSGPLAAFVGERFPKTVSAHRSRVDFVATALGAKGVAELERLATALYVSNRLADGSAEDRAAMLIELKPHVSRPEALHAIQEVDRICAEAETAKRAFLRAPIGNQ